MPVLATCSRRRCRARLPASADPSHYSALGVMLNVNYTNFDGEPVSVNDLLVKFTWGGDANLTGEINALDYALVNGGFLGHLTGWFNGDFDYSGQINALDYSIINTGFFATLAKPRPDMTITPGASPDEGDEFTLDLHADVTYWDWVEDYDENGNPIQVWAEFPKDPISSWTVDWGDGQVESVPNDSVTGNASPDHVYADDGAYTIRAWAKGTVVYYYAGQAQITVTEVAPTLLVTGDDHAHEGEPYTLALSASDPGSDPGDDRIESWTVDWGDGTDRETYPGDIEQVVHSFGFTSSAIIITARDEDGSYTMTKPFQVMSTSAISLSARPVYAQEIELSWIDIAETSSGYTVEQADDPAGSWNTIGTTDQFTTAFAATGPFSRGMSYYFRVSAVDFLSQTIYSNFATVRFGGIQLSAEIDRTTKPGSLVTISGPFADVAETHSVVIDWGDGTIDAAGGGAPSDPDIELWEIEGSGSVYGAHIYSAAGVYHPTITLLADDGASAGTTGTITVENSGPMLISISDKSIEEGDWLDLCVRFNDDDPDDTHTAIVDWGDETVEAAQVDEAGDAAGYIWGGHTYAENGTYTIQVSVTDGTGASATTSAFVVVSNVAPVADRGGIVRTVIDMPVTLYGGFYDPGMSIGETYTYGWIVRDSGDQVVAASTTQDLTFMPTVAGSYTAEFAVTDDDDATDSATYTIVARDSQTPPDTSVPLAPTQLAVSTVTDDSVTFTWEDNSDNEDGFLVYWSDDGTGFYEIDLLGANTTSYTDSYPVLNRSNHYYVTAFRDGEEQTLESGGTSVVTATPITPPVAFYDDNDGANERDTLTPFAVVHDHVLTGANLFGNDIDLASLPFRIHNYSQPSNGSLTIDEFGNLTYTPGPQWTGTDRFTYRLVDNDGRVGEPAEAAVDVTNARPVPQYAQFDFDFFAAVDAQVPGRGTWHNVMTGRVSAFDADDDFVMYRVVKQPEHGSLEFYPPTGFFYYSPDSSFAGYDQFEFLGYDGVGDGESAIVSIHGTAVSTYADLGASRTTQCGPLGARWTGTWLINPEGQGPSHIVVRQPTNGYLTGLPDGIPEYHPNPGFAGTDSFEFAIRSGNLQTAIATATFHVYTTPPEQWPQEIWAEGGERYFAVSDVEPTVVLAAQSQFLTYSDPRVTVAKATEPAHGRLYLRPDGAFRYVLTDPDFRGWDYFSFRYVGSTTNTDPQWVVLDVGYTPPVAHTEDQFRPNTFEADLKGVWGAYMASKARMADVVHALEALGSAARTANNISPDDEDAFDLAEAEMVAKHEGVEKAFARYTAQVQKAFSIAGDYMKHHRIYTQARRDAITAVMFLPRDIAGIVPNLEQLHKWSMALGSFDAGAVWMLADQQMVMQMAKDIHNACEQALRYGGLAAIAISSWELLTKEGAQVVLKQVIRNLVAAQIANFVAQNAAEIAARYGITVDADLLRIGADFFQVFTLWRAARAQRKGRTTKPLSSQSSALLNQAKSGGLGSLRTAGNAGSNPNIREFPGTAGDSRAIFDGLTKGGKVLKSSPGFALAQMPDGTYVTFRSAGKVPNTATGVAPPTVDINIPGQPHLKLKLLP
jgi:hypothetical protein